MIKNKIIVSLLLLSLVLNIFPTFIFGNTLNAEGEADVPVELTQSVTIFSVTVPTSLPIDVNGMGTVTVSTTNRIINNSFGPVEIKAVEVQPQNGWSIIDFNSDFKSLKVGSKQFGFQLNNANVGTDGSCSAIFPIIYGQDQISFTYDADIAPQNMITTRESIANVIFTVGWYSDIISNIENKYQFQYYSSVDVAVADINNGTIGDSADVDKEDAVAGIYINEDGVPSVAILKDTPSNRLNFTTTAMLNLNGHKLSFTGTKVAIGVSGASTEFTIVGQIAGSGIEITNTNTDNTKAIHIASGHCIVNGGTYVANSNGAGTDASVNSAILVAGTGSLTINNANISMNDTANGVSAAIIVNAGTNANISNCAINSSTVSGKSYGVDILGTAEIEDCRIISKGEDAKVFSIYNNGNANINNCTVRGYSNYNTDSSGYTAYSIGVENEGYMVIENSFVTGTHSGLENMSEVYVNGGTYEGYGHGGFYFIGEDSTDISYVKGATIRQSDMPTGYTSNDVCNQAGFYIGGGSNFSVYMDDCDIYSSRDQIVLRGTSGEQYNTLYISNSNIYDMDGSEKSVRIDNVTHKVYLGVGNNFTPEDTELPEVVISTDETYVN